MRVILNILNVFLVSVLCVACGGGDGSGQLNTGAPVTVTNTDGDLQITIGNGRDLLTAENNTVNNSEPFVVQVTDDNGAPKSGLTVTITSTPVLFHKGFYNIQQVNMEDQWVQNFSETCLSEDANDDKQLDPAEDTNGNGKMDPAVAVAIINAHPTLTPTVSAGAVQIDGSGTGYFVLTFPKSHADWAMVRLEATVNEGTSQAVDRINYTLTSLASDLSDTTIGIPNDSSPYGVAAGCDNIN